MLDRYGGKKKIFIFIVRTYVSQKIERAALKQHEDESEILGSRLQAIIKSSKTPLSPVYTV